jgi:hypothetical protein
MASPTILDKKINVHRLLFIVFLVLTVLFGWLAWFFSFYFLLLGPIGFSLYLYFDIEKFRKNGADKIQPGIIALILLGLYILPALFEERHSFLILFALGDLPILFLVIYWFTIRPSLTAKFTQLKTGSQKATFLQKIFSTLFFIGLIAVVGFAIYALLFSIAWSGRGL